MGEKCFWLEREQLFIGFGLCLQFFKEGMTQLGKMKEIRKWFPF